VQVRQGFRDVDPSFDCMFGLPDAVTRNGEPAA